MLNDCADNLSAEHRHIVPYDRPPATTLIITMPATPANINFCGLLAVEWSGNPLDL